MNNARPDQWRMDLAEIDIMRVGTARIPKTRGVPAGPNQLSRVNQIVHGISKSAQRRAANSGYHRSQQYFSEMGAVVLGYSLALSAALETLQLPWWAQ